MKGVWKPPVALSRCKKQTVLKCPGLESLGVRGSLNGPNAPCSRLAPALNQQEQIYLRSLTEVAGSVLGFDLHQAGAPGLEDLLAFVRLALNPSAQVRRKTGFSATITFRARSVSWNTDNGIASPVQLHSAHMQDIAVSTDFVLFNTLCWLRTQVRDLQSAFSGATSDPETLRVAQQLGQDVIDCLVAKQAERAGVSADQLFPAYSFLSSRSAAR